VIGRRRRAPQTLRELLRSTDDASVVIVGRGDHDSQYLENRIGVVGVPPTRPEADLPEHFSQFEGLEMFGRGEESIERPVVETLHQLVPQRLYLTGVASSDRPLQRNEIRVVLERALPCPGHLAEDIG
jgi:hypothetical protein